MITISKINSEHQHLSSESPVSSPFAAFSSHRPGFTPHLARLEAESIAIIREVAAAFRKPVMLYSHRQGFGRDAAPGPEGLLSRQAAVPAAACRYAVEVPGHDRVPGPDRASATGWSCWSTSTRKASRRGINPIASGSALHTQVMKTEGAEAGARPIRLRRGLRRRAPRRGEEPGQGAHLLASRGRHGWDPRNQRPELWDLYNTRISKGEIHPRLPAVELDRARHLGLHPGRGHSGRAALFRQAAAGRAARRHLDHASTTIACRSQPGETPRDAHGPLPHPWLLSADRRGREQRRDACRTSSPRCAAARTSERAGAPHRRDEGDASMEKKKREGYF